MIVATTNLSYLISNCYWTDVHRTLEFKQEECKALLSTDIDYVFHQAICTDIHSIPHEVLILLLEHFPNALDLNAFIAVTENPHLLRRSMEILLEYANNSLCETVRENAQRFTSMAVKRKNVQIVGLLIERFPHVLNNGEILALSCKCGTAEIVQGILTAGHHHNVGKAGGLYLKIKHGEDALDIAIRLYDEKHEERRNTLITCLQYANAERMGVESTPRDYPVLLAAAGLAPQHILKSFLKLYTSEIIKTTPSGRHAIFKAVTMSVHDNKWGKLPVVFNSRVLINACTNGNLVLVQRLLEMSCLGLLSEQTKSLLQSTECDENAVDVAADLFDKDDYTSCEILKTCLQYANAAKLGWKVPPPNYPITLAAIGLIPLDMAVNLGIQYPDEIKHMDKIGKLAVRKVLKMAHDEPYYASRLDARCQYRLSFKTGKNKLKSNLDPIPQ